MARSVESAPQQTNNPENNEPASLLEFRKDGDIEIISLAGDATHPHVEAITDRTKNQVVDVYATENIFGLIDADHNLFKGKVQPDNFKDLTVTQARNLIGKKTDVNTPLPLVVVTGTGIAYRDTNKASTRALYISTDEKKTRYLGQTNGEIGAITPVEGDRILIAEKKLLDLVVANPSDHQQVVEQMAKHGVAHINMDFPREYIQTVQANKAKQRAMAGEARLKQARTLPDQPHTVSTPASVVASVAGAYTHVVGGKHSEAREIKRALELNSVPVSYIQEPLFGTDENPLFVAGSENDKTNDHLSEEERQAQIDEARGFRVVNKRARTRDELLHDDINIFGMYQGKKINVPPMPDHAPTIHLGLTPEGQDATEESAASQSTNAEAVDAPVEVSIDDSSNRDVIEKSGWKENLKHPFHYLAARLDWIQMKYMERREKNSLSRPFSIETDSERRYRGVMIAVGAVAIALAAVKLYELGVDHGITQHVDGSALPQGGGHDANSNNEAANAAAAAAAEHAKQVAANHAELLNSPTFVIPQGGGGEAFAQQNGVDKSVWYQNQAEFNRLFPADAYPMSDGNEGFQHPGRLSDGAIEFWAKKFGKWL
jgi:hypothetical protein